MKVSLVAVAAVVVTLSLSSVALADDLSDLDIFTTAGIFYENANYDEAAQTYQHLVGLGYEDATLYYNLANSHYKSEDMGRAVLNYLRARRLAPFDEDITANLAFVRKQLDNPNSQEATTPVFVQISELAPWITFNQSAVATLLSWLILGLLAVLYLWGRRFRKAIALRQFAAVAILCILSLALSRLENTRIGFTGSKSRWLQPRQRVYLAVKPSAEKQDSISKREAKSGWSRR